MQFTPELTKEAGTKKVHPANLLSRMIDHLLTLSYCWGPLTAFVLGIFLVTSSMVLVKWPLREQIKDIVSQLTLGNLLLGFAFIIIAYAQTFVRLDTSSKLRLGASWMGLAGAMLIYLGPLTGSKVGGFIGPGLVSLAALIGLLKGPISSRRIEGLETLATFDQPISNPYEDHLSRNVLAQSLGAIIGASPPDEPLRVGILGAWGEGKTSFANLLAYHLKVEGHVPVWFNPWAYSKKGRLIEGLGEAISQQVRHMAPVLPFGRLTALIRAYVDRKADNPLLDTLLHELVASSGTPAQANVQANIARYLERSLHGRKLVVFIDDLDRIDSVHLVQELLMAVKELYTIRGISYVIAIDDKQLNDRLRDLYGQSTEVKYLDKIVQLPFRLPRVGTHNFDSYFRSLLAEYAGKVKKTTLLSLHDLLPRNPRTLKRYVHHLSLLNPILSHLGEEDLDWAFLYLAQMLVIEEPRFVSHLLTDRDSILELTWAQAFKNRVSSLRTSARDNDDDHLQSEFGQRVASIAKEMRRRVTALVDETKVAAYFSIIGKEDFAPLEGWEPAYAAASIHPETMIAWDSSFQVVYVPRLLNHCSRLFSAMVEESIMNRMMALESELYNAVMQLRFFWGQSNIQTRFGDEQIADLFMHLARFARSFSQFRTPAYQRVIHLIEETLVTAARAASTSRDTYWGLFQLDDDLHGSFAPLKARLILIFEEAIASDLLPLFRTKRGIASIRGKENAWPELSLLFQHSPFHTSERLGDLADLVQQATTNDDIHENFVDYFRLQCDVLNGGFGFVTREAAKKLIDDLSFMRLIWSGVIAGRLNRRVVGSILRDLEEWHAGGLNLRFVRIPYWFDDEEYAEIKHKYQILIDAIAEGSN